MFNPEIKVVDFAVLDVITTSVVDEGEKDQYEGERD